MDRTRGPDQDSVTIRASMHGNGEQPSQPRPGWLSEREPTSKDVEDANQMPERTWLRDFRSCLLASEDALNIEQLMHIKLRVCQPRFLTANC
jgi:hypothetical protein